MTVLISALKVLTALVLVLSLFSTSEALNCYNCKYEYNTVESHKEGSSKCEEKPCPHSNFICLASVSQLKTEGYKRTIKECIRRLNVLESGDISGCYTRDEIKETFGPGRIKDVTPHWEPPTLSSGKILHYCFCRNKDLCNNDELLKQSEDSQRANEAANNRVEHALWCIYAVAVTISFS